MKKARIMAIVVCACILIGTVIVLAAPGNEDDPVISLSYLKNVFMNEVTEYIDTQNGLAKIELKAGQKVIGQSGTEFILRMGSATVIATESGGLADITDGYDKANKAEVSPNHMLIVPVSDGRGMKANNDVIVLVKGKYTIE
ncbi:MAG: hypothetical protein Q8873_03325 [Bacillota bacterium]|nr:hypothetical protein [Bacillota bacterium]